MKPSELTLGAFFERSGSIQQVLHFEHRYKNVYYINDIQVDFSFPIEIEQYCKSVRISEEHMRTLGFEKVESWDYCLRIGRKTFVLVPLEEDIPEHHNDWMIMHSYDTGMDFQPIRDVEYVHQVQSVILSITDTVLPHEK